MRLNRRRLGVALESRILGAIALLVILGTIILMAASGISTPSPANPHHELRSLVAHAHLPLVFEPNLGQTDPRVKFLAHGNGYGLFLTADQAILTLQSEKPPASILRMKLSGASAGASVAGSTYLPGKSNYLIGNDPAKWHRNIPQFARVRYGDVYPGINLEYYGNQGNLEYDFDVAPDADPSQVTLQFNGQDNLSIDAQGSLVLAMGSHDLRLQAPRVYQKFGEERRMVEGGFELRGKNQVGFRLGTYDRTRSLVIDPVLSYSTYLGGTSDEACSVITGTGTGVPGCPAIAVDFASNAYIVGSTKSIDFPLVTPEQSSLAGTANLSISKFNNTGSILLFSTYLGGNGTDYPGGIAVDSGNNVYLGGTTSSSNFPTSSGAFQATAASTGTHAFVSKLDSTGQTLLYSTYLSGNGTDSATGIAVDAFQDVYATGTTASTNFPTTLGAFQTSSKATDQFFLSKLNPAQSGSASLVYSTYIGGSLLPSGATAKTFGGGVAVDSSSNAYISAGTNYTDMPMLDAYQGTSKGGIDIYVAKFNPSAASGAQLIYGTYLGGSGDDIGYAIAVDSTSNAYLTGSTTSTDFVAAGTGVFQPASGLGPSDAFLAKFGTPCTGSTCTTTAVPLNYFSYLGGSGTDIGLAIAVDSIQGARITGSTDSTNFPSVNNPVQAGAGGGIDAFATRIDTTATTADAPGHYSTYYGGTGTDIGTGIAVDTQGASYIAGETSSSSGLLLVTPFQGALSGPTDDFVAKLGPILNLAFVPPPTVSPTTVGVGNQVTFTYPITNSGDPTGSVIFTDTLPPTGATFVSASASPGSCGSATGGIVVCNIGTLNSGATSTVTVILTPSAPITPGTTPIVLGNSASVSAPGSALVTTSSNVTVNDFNLSVSPANATVPAGVPATYNVTVTPTGSIPDSVSISCGSGLPTGASCTETTNPLPNLSNGPASTTLVINTTARVTTTTRLWHQGAPFNATWLPLSGLALLGAGVRRKSRQRLILIGLLLACLFTFVISQAGCSTKKSVTTTTGTPAGTYTVTVDATSGSAVRSTTVTLVVQ